jgi:hypothetical protein
MFADCRLTQVESSSCEAPCPSLYKARLAAPVGLAERHRTTLKAHAAMVGSPDRGSNWASGVGSLGRGHRRTDNAGVVE